MPLGWLISGGAHAIFLALILFGGDFFRQQDPDLRPVANVSLISAAEFDAQMNATPEPVEQAPEVSVPDIEPIAAPEFNADAGEAPDADAAPVATTADFVEDPSAADTEADLTALTQEVAQPEVAVEVAAPDEAAPELAAPSMPGITGLDSVNTAPRAPSLNRPPAPVQAPRIAGTASPKPPRPDKPAEVAQDATVPSQDTTETAEAQDAAAPEEATTAASPDPASGDEDGIALRRSSSPRVRPRNFESQVAQAEEAAREAERQAQAEAEAREQEEIARLEREQAEREERERLAEEERLANEIAAAVAQAAAQAGGSDQEPTPSSAPAGPPLTAGEKDGLRLAVQRCWAIPAGLPNSSDLRVVVGVDLDPDGRIIGDTRLVEPANSDSTEIRVAYEAARRALFRCQGSGYDLPRDKYEHWKKLEVGFNPEGMLARW